MKAGAERARSEFSLLLVLGLELTNNQDDPNDSAHAVALGLASYISVDDGIVAALEAAQEQSSAVIAAHPYAGADATPLRATAASGATGTR